MRLLLVIGEITDLQVVDVAVGIFGAGVRAIGGVVVALAAWREDYALDSGHWTLH